MLNWTETELKERLATNPALRINPKYSTPVKKVVPKRPHIAFSPMKFYDEEKPVKFTLPFVYPSLNKMLRMNWYERKRQEDDFRDAVRWYLALYKIKGFRSPVIIEAVIYHPRFRFRDRDNFCLKWLKDSLKGIVIVDDDPRYVAQEKVEFQKGKARIELKITPVKEV